MLVTIKKQLIRIANISHLKMLINLEHLRVETDLTYSNSGTVDSLALGQFVLMLFLPFPEPLTAARLLQRRDRFLADSWANQSDPVCILVVWRIRTTLWWFWDMGMNLTLSYNICVVLTHSRLKDLEDCAKLIMMGLYTAPWFWTDMVNVLGLHITLEMPIRPILGEFLRSEK